MTIPSEQPPSRRSVLAGGLVTAAGAGLTLPGPTDTAHASTTTAGSATARRQQNPTDDAANDEPTEPGVGYANRQFLIDGEPSVILAGEIHYFRLPQQDWQSRLDEAKAAGLTAIATYIPWLWHELPDGTIDVTGNTKPERDLGAFLDLCIENGFEIIARPGPFVMAELKNNGVPHRVYEDNPGAVPTGWDGEETPGPTLDYLAPDYLAEARRWYSAVIPVIAERLHRDNRPGVIAVQLDNEIGMISWVSNAPDFTDHMLADFNSWLEEEYGDALSDRYPFADDGPAERNEAIQSPQDDYAAALMHDLGRFKRGRFARYAAQLRDYAEEFGARGIPFLINVHGTSGDGADNYPIGLSQLMESYSGVEGMVSGVDMYLGEIGLSNTPDLYMINAFTNATNDADQPLTCLEFDAGHGDYGQALFVAFDPSAVQLKTRMCIAQGAKLINYYLFAGGFNPPLDEPVGDGNDRIGSTGERHGFNAPVDPEGERNLSFDATRDAVSSAGALGDVLARMRPEFDPVTLGFVPDLYLTEYPAPGRESANQIVTDVQGWRGTGPRNGSLLRALLFTNRRVDSLNLQDGDINPDERPVLALAGTEHLGTELQRRLVRYVRAGGHLLLVGKLPVRNMAGNDSTALADALRLTPGDTITGDVSFYPSVTAHGWAGPLPENRVGRAQLFEARGNTEVVLRELSTGEGCGFDVRLGSGRAVVITADYITDLTYWNRVFDAVGADASITHTGSVPGVVILSTVDADDGRLFHVFNTSAYADTITARENGDALFGGASIQLPGRTALMLPANLSLSGLDIAYATAEPIALGDGEVTFRSAGDEAVVAVDGPATSPDAETTSRGGRTVLRSRRREFTVQRR